MTWRYLLLFFVGNGHLVARLAPADFGQSVVVARGSVVIVSHEHGFNSSNINYSNHTHHG